MATKSIAAGLLMFRRAPTLTFFIVHPGGPFFARKDAGHWTIPKGEPNNKEELLATAVREFFEETAISPQGPYLPLGSIMQKSGKIVHAWAFEGTHDNLAEVKSNMFRLEWPPRSGNFKEFPEIDKAEWMTYEKAKVFIKAEQIAFLDRLVKLLSVV